MILLLRQPREACPQPPITVRPYQQLPQTDASSLGGCNGTGSITRTWKAEDGCGNTNICNQIIRVIDTEVPIITCPGVVTIQCDDSTAPAATGGMATATDNCTAIPTITSNDASSLGRLQWNG